MKSLSTVIVLFLFINLGITQTKWTIGTIGGVDASSLNVDYQTSLSQSKLLPRVGLRLGYQLNNKFSLISGFGISSQGDREVLDASKFTTITPGITYDKHITSYMSSYLDIPLHVRYALGGKK